MTREEAWKRTRGYLYDALSGEEADEIIKALEQEPFINKPCVSSGVCEHDKNKILDKIRAEIEQIEINGHISDVECFNAGINVVLDIIDKYREESGGRDE